MLFFNTSSTLITNMTFSRDQLSKNGVWLIPTVLVAGHVLVGSKLIENPEQGLTFSPVDCPLKGLTGIPCPTCGATRSLLLALDLDWKRSLEYHFLGLSLLVGVWIFWLFLVFKKTYFLQALYTRFSLSPRKNQFLGLGALIYIYWGYILRDWSHL